MRLDLGSSSQLHLRRAIRNTDRGMLHRDMGFLGQKALAVGKVQRVKAEIVAFRLRQGYSGGITLHYAPDTPGNFSEQVAQFEIRNYAVGEIEHQLKTVVLIFQFRLGFTRSFVMQGTVNGQGK